MVSDSSWVIQGTDVRAGSKPGSLWGALSLCAVAVPDPQSQCPAVSIQTPACFAQCSVNVGPECSLWGTLNYKTGALGGGHAGMSTLKEPGNINPQAIGPKNATAGTALEATSHGRPALRTRKQRQSARPPRSRVSEVGIAGPAPDRLLGWS